MAESIAVIKGDGIGVEVVDEALKVLRVVCERFDIACECSEYMMGGCAYDNYGDPLPKESLQGALQAKAVLFGAIGGAKWENLPKDKRPESGLLRLRKELGVFANLRPAMVFDELVEASALKPEVITGVDILIVRELISGIYFGEPRGKEKNRAYNTMAYSVQEIERIAHKAFALALSRSKKLCSVDKANVLEVSELWREVVERVAKEYPQVALSHQYVDNASMQLIRDPRQFDVVLTGNLFGDILSDEASQITGSIGLLPSASVGESHAIYEPIHGSAPDIAGQGVANPIAAILSMAMMLEISLNHAKAANAVRKAVSSVLKAGARTQDIARFGCKKLCSTQEMGDLIAQAVARSVLSEEV
ncbi:3-isopropylmalate dehydrogenase [Helicobacter zhangjianzhongii]|uniref:3-isopropylmalate dehydrogenase n=1 Tax=Helicobacter zhangjianzhongii TaxID=2974574 RepID=UPI00255434E6|nr:3-isopropylmalate dehydrogenase [Helicobacter sp. CPD2-1]MDL0080878.1 3-isopropylmalate dehydrogenase [Helicobacter sp. CPD2-1]